MSIEVGSAYVSLIPTARGFAAKMQSELAGDIGKAGKNLGAQLGQGIGDEAGTAAGDGTRKGLLGRLGAGKALIGGAGLAIGAVLVKGMTDALSADALNAKLSAQLGLTEKQSATVGKSAGKLFGAGYGTGIDQINEGIASVISNVDGMRGASEDTLTRISGKVVSTANIFDQDMGGVTRAVSQLMRTGLAPSADAALDIITRGFQTGADKSQDFLDTLNEYSVQFQKLGLDGATATGLLSQGLQNGARDADVVADALKEFSIRAIDGSTTTAAGFKQLGLDAAQMSAQIAKGGKPASAGLQLVLDRLRAIKDPVKQSQAAVALFGTQAEDLGKSLYALDPSKAAAGLGEVAGAADKANAAFNNTPTAVVKSFVRQLQQGLVTVLAKGVIPAIRGVMPLFGKLGELIGRLSPVLSRLGSGAASALAPLASTVTNRLLPAVQSLVQYFAGKLGPIYAQVAQIVRSTLLPILASLARFVGGSLVPAVVKIYAAIGKQLRPVLDAFYGVIQSRVLPAVQLLTAKFAQYQPVVQKVTGVVVLVIGKILEFAAAIAGRVLPVAIRFAGWLISVLVKNLITTIATVAKVIKATVDFGVGLYRTGAAVVTFAKGVIKWVGSVGQTWTRIWNQARTLVSSVINSAKTTANNGIAAVVKYFAGIPARIVAQARNMASAGKRLADSAVAGIRSNIGSAASVVTSAIASIPGKIAGHARGFASAGRSLISSFVAGMRGAKGLVSDIAGNVWSAVRQLLNSAIGRINAALQFTIKLPAGASININPPDIPRLASGGRATAGTLAVIGEGREPETVLPDSMLRGLLERTAAAATAAVPTVRVFIGTTELTDIVRVQVDQAQSAQVRQLAGGRRI
ncbi:phage tail tape measure protein [Kribbella sp. NPDC058245]|uniref:phage tail tape measure protein n=1 Tax=Kribbella sp. NPDC058245 TaxID=3346399 RepID=UPI0036E81677